MAVTAITLVWATSVAEMDGLPPRIALTFRCTGALVTSCRSVCTSVGVTAAGATPNAVLPAGCTRSCAVAEYCLAWVKDRPRLGAGARCGGAAIHHFRLRTNPM